MSRLPAVQDYWNSAALDPDVDVKYICDYPLDVCVKDIGELKGKVLEIGCGVGRLLKPGYYGIDVSQNMLDIAIKRRPESTIKLTTGDIPFDSNSFDTVFSFLVFQHLKIDEITTYIHEAYRVLKPHGIFKFQFVIGNEDEPFSNHYEIYKMLHLMEAAGFKSLIERPSNVHFQWWWIEGMK